MPNSPGSGDSPSILNQGRHFRLHFQMEVRIPAPLFGEEIQKVPLRHQGDEAGKTPAHLKFGLRMYRWAGTHPVVFRLGAKLAAWGSRVVARQGWIKKLPGPLSAWTQSRDFPAFAPQSFSAQLKRRRSIHD